MAAVDIISPLLVNASADQLLHALAAHLDQNADDYNQLADKYEALDSDYRLLLLRDKELTQDFNEVTEKNNSLAKGNKLLMDERQNHQSEVTEVNNRYNELMQELQTERSEKQKLQRALEQSKGAQRATSEALTTAERELKELKAHGDPKKIIEQNKTLRAKNTELQQGIDQAKKVAIDAEKEVAAMMDHYGQLPSFTSPTMENIYIHPKPLKMSMDVNGVPTIHTFIALTYWTNEGVGRVITWDDKANKLRFASFGHKTVDAKLAPSQPVLEWAQDWFDKNVIAQGVVQVFRSKYQTKLGKK